MPSANFAFSTPSQETLLCKASLSGRSWAIIHSDVRLASAIAREQNIPEILARVLVSRGICDETARDFLHPSLKSSMPDPCHLLDMDAAAERVAAAVVAGERIAVFGDYDVDGATSTALLIRYFRMLGKEAIAYIPDRVTEGYGPNTQALLGLKERGCSLIITVDCGTLAFAPLEAASDAGLDVIVVDHHQGEARKPKALAVVNPNRLDETSSCRMLAAVGVSFLLAVAVSRALRKTGFFNQSPEPDLRCLLDLVALGTVCDVVPLTGLNRAFVTQGLKIMAARGNTGINALLYSAGAHGKISAYTCGFILGPRVNAGGRVGKSDYGARLLATEDEGEAGYLAQELERFNRERKAIESLMLDEALTQAEAQNQEPLIIAHGDGWHEGVIGIVAGRIKEQYGKPAAVIAWAGETGKASARSVSGFDFGASVIAAVQEGLLTKGGGHAMAAGFTLPRVNLATFRHFLELRLKPAQAGLAHGNVLFVDGCVSVPGANAELALMLERAGPYGAGHAQPKLCIRQAKIIQAECVGAGSEHVRLLLTDAGGIKGTLSAIAFRSSHTPMGQALLAAKGRTAELIGTLKADEWMGRVKASLHIEDAVLHG